MEGRANLVRVRLCVMAYGTSSIRRMEGWGGIGGSTTVQGALTET